MKWSEELLQHSTTYGVNFMRILIRKFKKGEKLERMNWNG